MRRARWGKVVNGGRWTYCTVRPAFLNNYPGVWEAEGGADARAGGRATAPTSSPRCLSATTPSPRAAATHGDPCQEPEDGRTVGRRTYAAALADHRRWTAHEDDAAARLFATNILQLLTLNFDRSRNIVVKISQRINRRKTLRLMP